MTLLDTSPRTTNATDKTAQVADDDTAAAELASWPARAGALSLDVLPGVAVLVAAALTALSVPVHGRWWWVVVCIGVSAVLLTGFNRLVLPGCTGQTLSRKTFGIAIVRRDRSPAGPWMLLVRDFALLFDTVPMLAGWVWPLKDARRRTFADILSRTE